MNGTPTVVAHGLILVRSQEYVTVSFLEEHDMSFLGKTIVVATGTGLGAALAGGGGALLGVIVTLALVVPKALPDPRMEQQWRNSAGMGNQLRRGGIR